MTQNAIRPPRTLAWKLLLAIVPTVIVAVGVIVWAQYTVARRHMLAEIEQGVRTLAERTSGSVDNLLRQRYDDLFTVAETPLLADYYHNVDYQLLNEAETYRQELERYLLSFSSRSAVYSEVLYLDRRGREVCAIERGSIRPRREGPPAYFGQLASLKRGSWWTSPMEMSGDGGAVLRFAKPVHDETGRFKGALVFGYDLAQIRSLLGSIRAGGSTAAYLETRAGRFPRDTGLRGGPGEVLTASSPLKERPWRVVIEASADDFLAPLRRVRDGGFLYAVAVTLPLIALLLWLVRSITRPVAALVDAARRIGRGDLSHRIALAADDELGALSRAFNEMTESLENNRRVTSELQSQLIQAEKLSAIGMLVSAVAHELNNPLGSVCAYVQVALMEAGDARLKDDLQHVFHNAMRCRKVVDNLLFFARKSRQERARVHLNDVAATALELLEYRLLKTEHVVVERRLADELPPIVGDFQQLVQVLVNLINNACDAMGEAPRRADKRIAISTSAAPDRVMLSVEDTGPGIPAQARARIFEPFFTTKEPGHGTGLGLSICRQIVEDHGGSIAFESREGAGATFVIKLPPATGEELTRLERPARPAPLPAVPGRRVLVADDERDIAELIARLLREDGDEVDVTVHGPQALEWARQRRYDLVISDFEMEQVKGEELYDALMSRPAPERAATLFVTGDILNPKVLRFLERTQSAYLAKPFDVAELRQTVRALLQPAAKKMTE